MRFVLLMLATAASGLACEKDPALSTTAKSLEPGTAAAAAASVSATTPRPAIGGASTGAELGGGPSTTGPSGVSAAAVATNSVATSSGSTAEGLARTAQAPSPRSAGPTSAGPTSATPVTGEEGNGEPMDDVDDEVVTATDKSGVDNADPDEGRSGPVDEDSEGADIDLRE